MTIPSKWDREASVAMGLIRSGMVPRRAADAAGISATRLYNRAAYKKWARSAKAAKRKTATNGHAIAATTKPHAYVTTETTTGDGAIIAALRAEVALLHRVIDKLTR